MHGVSFASLLLACACGTKAQVDVTVQDPAKPAQRPVIVPGRDLGVPTRSCVLPDDLQETSAIAAADDHTLACVQDEKGALFFFDLDQGRIAVGEARAQGRLRGAGEGR